MQRFRLAIALLLLTVSLHAIAATTDYDGRWTGTLSCTAYADDSTSTEFKRNNEYRIENGQIDAKYLTKDQRYTYTLEWQGNVVNGSASLTGNSSRDDGGRWIY